MNVSYLKTFGTKVHVLDKEPGKDKFASRTIVGYFVGYPVEAVGYKLWIPEWRKFIVSRGMRFQNGKFFESESKVSNQLLLESQCEKNIVRKSIEIKMPSESQSNVPIRQSEGNQTIMSVSQVPSTSST